MNVFGRNLNGIQKVTDRTGRDHFGNHSVMVMIGKNVKSSVIGGVVAATNGVYSARRHRLGHGRAGDGRRRPVDARATPRPCARWARRSASPTAVAAGDYTAGAGGKVVTGALANLPAS